MEISTYLNVIMKVYNQQTTGAEQAHFQFYDFDRFSGVGNFTFIDRPQVFTKIPRQVFNDKLVYLELEEPNRFFVDIPWFNHFGYDQFFSKVFSICPYTTEWLNKLDGGNRESVFIPIKWQPYDCMMEESESFDVIYCGHIYPGPIEENVRELEGLDYRVISNTDHPMTTNRGVNHRSKLQLISRSKISLISNLLYPTIDHIKQVKKINRWQENEAFSRLDDGLVPQIKGRVFEAAMCQSLILCQKDPWNVIERFFIPDIDFVYYEKGRAKEKIREILANYQDYEKMVLSAYKKVKDLYTTKSFYNRFLWDLK